MRPVREAIDIADFVFLREYLRGVCGLDFADDKYPRVAQTVGERMSELGTRCFSEYRQLLTSSSSGKEELATLSSLLTVGETYFFRNKDHWRAFEECVLPWLVERGTVTGQRRIRVWSAGCSTGEEAYTAAIAITRSLPGLSRWSVEIVGTDLNRLAVASARAASYTQNSFRSVSPDLRDHYFEQDAGGRYRPREDIRRLVRFGELNLLDAQATGQMRDYDVILCRNVMIYFDATGVQTVLRHLHDSLRLGGYLFLGHADNLSGDMFGFASLNVCDTFIYKAAPWARRKDASARGETYRAADIPPPPRIGVMNTGEVGGNTSRAVAVNVPAAVVKAECQASCASAVPTAVSLDDLRRQAVVHLCAEEGDAARRIFEEILSQVPHDVESLCGMALLLAGNGNGDAALQCCHHILDVCPTSAEAYCIMALVHEGQGEVALALRELEKATYLDDTFSMAHFRRGSLHDHLGHREAAAREFVNTLKALPEDEERRIRIYSGGFDKLTIERICEQRLSAANQEVQRP